MNIIQSLTNRLGNISGAWLVFLAALAWSMAAGVVKVFDTHPLLLVGLRSLIGGLVLAATIRPKKIVFDRWLLLTIIVYTCMVTVTINALRMTAAAVVIAMQYTAPLWIFLVIWLVSKKLDKQRLVVMIIIAAAISLFLIFPVPGTTGGGNWLALLLGILFAAMSVCLKKLRHDNTLGIVSIFNLGAALIVLPLCLILPDVPLYVGPTDWLFIAFLGIFQLTAGYVFYSLGIKKVTPQKATLLGMWQFVLAPIWAFLAVGELATPIVWVACILLIGALLWDNRIDSKRAALKI